MPLFPGLTSPVSCPCSPIYKTNLQKFLANLTRRHRHVLVPYHLPTRTAHEMSHPRLSKALWNHKRKVTDLGRQQKCQCQQFAKNTLKPSYIKDRLSRDWKLSLCPNCTMCSTTLEQAMRFFIQASTTTSTYGRRGKDFAYTEIVDPIQEENFQTSYKYIISIKEILAIIFRCTRGLPTCTTALRTTAAHGTTVSTTESS